MYHLFSAKYPFFHHDRVQLEEDICNDPVLFNHACFSQVPESAKSLIKKMLNKNPSSRIKAADCLVAPFFTESTGKEQKLAQTMKVTLEADVFKNLVSYKGISKLKKAALNLLVRQAVLDYENDTGTENNSSAVLTRQRAELLRK